MIKDECSTCHSSWTRWILYINACQSYKVLDLSIMDYASLVLVQYDKWTLKTLDVIHNHAICIIMDCLENTRTDGMQLKLGLPLLQHRILLAMITSLQGYIWMYPDRQGAVSQYHLVYRDKGEMHNAKNLHSQSADWCFYTQSSLQASVTTENRTSWCQNYTHGPISLKMSVRQDKTTGSVQHDGRVRFGEVKYAVGVVIPHGADTERPSDHSSMTVTKLLALLIWVALGEVCHSPSATHHLLEDSPPSRIVSLQSCLSTVITSWIWS